MKNIFDYATNELSQDAFLCWLFANHDEPEISNAVHDLLKYFCDFTPDEKVLDVEVWRQWKKIDIWFVIATNKRKKIDLLIEDKTYSCEHNQLGKYNGYAASYTGAYKIFYKTSVVSDEEKSRVTAAGWSAWDINGIYPIFEKYANCRNLILNQYVEHISKIYGACKNTQKPRHSKNNVDLLAWQAYFNNVVIPRLNGNDKEFICKVKKVGQYSFEVLQITKLGYNETVPYLEIRCRDCAEDKFKALILCYGMAESNIPKQQKLIDKIKATPELKCSRLVWKRRGKPSFPKQIGFSPNGLTATTDDEFIALANKYIKIYLQIMQAWE